MKIKLLLTVMISAAFLMVAAAANAALVHIAFDNNWTVDFDDSLLSTNGSIQIYADPNVESPHVSWIDYPFKDDEYAYLNRTEFQVTSGQAQITFAQAGKIADVPQWENNLTGRQNTIYFQWADRPSYSGSDIYEFLTLAKDTYADFYAAVNATGRILGTPFSDYRVHITELSREDTPSVPVPGAIWLLFSGLIGLVGLNRKFNR